MGCIYLHRNKINGKVYIGQTKFDNENKRFDSGRGYSKCTKFYNAIKKYGWDNFEHLILCEYVYNRNELNRLETEWFELYKRILGKENIYNTGRTGDAHNCSEELRKKFKEINKGKRHSIETEFKKGFHYSVQTEIKKGQHLSPKTEFKKGNIPFNKGKTNVGKTKKVQQLDLNGNVIKEYVSIADAARENNLHFTSIIHCCKGDIQTAKGFIWKYK